MIVFITTQHEKQGWVKKIILKLILIFYWLYSIKVFNRKKNNRPSPIPLFNKTPQENHIALDRFNAVSSLFDCANRYRPNGLNRSNRYKMTATTCTESSTNNHNSVLNGLKKEPRSLLLVFFFTKIVMPTI